MDLIGKYIGIVMPLEHALAILGAPSKGETDMVYVLGRVAGETPQLGLWLDLESMTYDQTAQTVVPDLPADKRKYLVGWRLIPTAVLFEEPPRRQPAVGFKPR
jgi:hypothetical protein